jgi:ABC-2 type transport system permease protein
MRTGPCVRMRENKVNKTLLVMRQELRCTFSRRAYLFFAFGVPLLLILAVAVVRFVRMRSGTSGSPAGSISTARSSPARGLEGFVDLSGIIQQIPANMDGKANRSWGLVSYTGESQAKQALNAGEISAYYLIPVNYLEMGKIQYVYPDGKSYLAGGQEWTIQRALTENLLADDPQLADRVWNPVWNLRETALTSSTPAGSPGGEDCSRPSSTCRSNQLIRLLPTIMAILLYMTLTISSSMLFNSITAEKENRTIEVLLASLHPRQLLAGKTLALGLAGLLQTAFWAGAAFVSLRLGGTTLRLPPNFSFPADILAWSLLLFLGGYLLYASLMAGAGALVPRLKEAGVASYIAIIPLFFGYIVGLFAPLSQASEALLPVLLSLFPLTTPVVMVMRLTDGAVPWWQLALSVGMTYLGAYLALQAAAAAFRAHYLISGQPFSLGRYLKAMVGGK